jgi:hypothetical protein
MKKFDHPAKKKPRTAYPKPEVHIALNITPVQGVDGSLNHGSYIVSQGPVTQPPSTSTHQADPIEVIMGFLVDDVVVDCLTASRGLTILEVLRLMDADKPKNDLLKYVDAYSDLCDHGIMNILDIYMYPVELLASFGDLGREGINNIRRYAWEMLLRPLTCLRTGESDGDDEVLEVASNKVSTRGAGSSQGVVRSGNHEVRELTRDPQHVRRGRDEIQQWVDGVERDDMRVDGSGSVEVVESGSEDDASSQSQEV